jgi:hypothetical protein
MLKQCSRTRQSKRGNDIENEKGIKARLGTHGIRRVNYISTPSVPLEVSLEKRASLTNTFPGRNGTEGVVISCMLFTCVAGVTQHREK